MNFPKEAFIINTEFEVEVVMLIDELDDGFLSSEGAIIGKHEVFNARADAADFAKQQIESTQRIVDIRRGYGGQP